LAERYHYGDALCECNNTRPSNRDKCFTCRLDG
jgi:hypothetical protein